MPGLLLNNLLRFCIAVPER